MSGGNPYETLGVARDASPDAIRQAYFRLVRVHTPEDAPERFQAVSEAYRVLSDPDARARLDRELGFPADIADGLRDAHALLETDPRAAAVRALRVLSDAPRPATVRFAVAILCLRAGEHRAAVPLLEELTREDPANGEIRHALGDAYAGAGRHAEAEAALRQAISTAPHERGPVLSLADVLEDLGRADDALRTLRSALPREAAPGIPDLPVLLRMYTLYARKDRADDMRRVLAAVRRTVPAGDAEASHHVAVQLAVLGDRFAQARLFETAHALFAEAATLTAHDGIRDRAARLAPLAKVRRCAMTAVEDPKVPEWIRALLRARFGPPMQDAEFRKLLDSVAAAMSRRVAAADREWAAFAGTYEAAAEHVRDLFDAVRGAATRSAPPAAGARSAGTGSRAPSAAASSPVAPAQRGAPAAAPVPAAAETWRSRRDRRARNSESNPSESRFGAIVAMVLIGLLSTGLRMACREQTRAKPDFYQQFTNERMPSVEQSWKVLEAGARTRLRAALGREPTKSEIDEEVRGTIRTAASADTGRRMLKVRGWSDADVDAALQDFRTKFRAERGHEPARSDEFRFTMDLYLYELRRPGTGGPFGPAPRTGT